MGEEEFLGLAAARYQSVLHGLSTRGMLDDDPALSSRILRLLPALMQGAAAIKPQSASWAWEFHVTGDAAQNAFCMAGGKVLVGSAFVRQLALDDGELAMLLGHEIAHALAGHRSEAAPSSFEGDLSQRIRQSEIAFAQESEADEIGMGLAHRAGWPSASLVSFYEKLAAAEGAGAFNSTHPAAAQRLAMARTIAARLGR